MKCKCVESLTLEKVDENGFLSNKYASIPLGSIWYQDSDVSIIGGEIHLECLENSDEFGWIEITKEDFEQCFEPLCEEGAEHE